MDAKGYRSSLVGLNRPRREGVLQCGAPYVATADSTVESGSG